MVVAATTIAVKNAGRRREENIIARNGKSVSVLHRLDEAAEIGMKVPTIEGIESEVATIVRKRAGTDNISCTAVYPDD